MTKILQNAMLGFGANEIKARCTEIMENTSAPFKKGIFFAFWSTTKHLNVTQQEAFSVTPTGK